MAHVRCWCIVFAMSQRIGARCWLSLARLRVSQTVEHGVRFNMSEKRNAGTANNAEARKHKKLVVERLLTGVRAGDASGPAIIGTGPCETRTTPGPTKK